MIFPKPHTQFKQLNNAYVTADKKSATNARVYIPLTVHASAVRSRDIVALELREWTPQEQTLTFIHLVQMTSC